MVTSCGSPELVEGPQLRHGEAACHQKVTSRIFRSSLASRLAYNSTFGSDPVGLGIGIGIEKFCRELCPELDIASQGETVEEAKANLREAVELFFECADIKEIKSRLSEEVYISRFEAAYA